jgi:lipoprotein-anchoring transpeptidase ErfK/SrfK
MSALRSGRERRVRLALVILLPLLAVAVAPRDCAAAQRATPPAASVDGLPGTPVVPRTRPGAEPRHVRISLEDRRLYLMSGERVVWSAPVGIGVGDTLEHRGQFWEFSTPRGEFQVQRKERDPVWFLPDWVFVRRGEPIPPRDSPRRREEGSLGAAALYLSPEIAIHGTDDLDGLGHEVSHGCIRMSDEDVTRLYREIGVGTTVVVY